MGNTNIKKNLKSPYQFLSGGGEMGELMRTKNWSETLIGTPENWPQSLRTTLSILLNSRFPMFLFWGPHLICFYNDAYRPSLGNGGKHPGILGSRGEDYWGEIWHIIKPLIDQVLAGGESTWSEDQLIPIYRNGKLEDVYWTFSYSPVNDETEKPAGVFVTCTETTGKVNTVKTLEESNRRFFNDIMQAPVAMCFFRGKDHVVEIANEMMLELWGKLKDEVINKPIFEALPEVKNQGLEELIDKVYTTGEKFIAYERPVSLSRNGGLETLYVNFTYQALKELDNSISGIIALASDVTPQVSARKKLEESKQRFQAAVNAIEGILWTNNAAGEMTGEQPGWAELTGQSFDEYQGYGWSKAVHPDDAQPTIDAWNEALKYRKIFVFEHRVKLKNNTWNIFSVKAIPLLNSDGSIIECVGVHTNITDQKKSEAIIRESEQRFRNVANSAPVLIWMTDTEKTCTFLNKAWLNYTGKNKEEEYGFGWMDGLHPEDYERCVDTFNKAFNNREPFYMEYRVKRYDGEYRWLSDNGTARFTDEGIFEGYIGACMDIHDSIIFQKKLKEDEERLNIVIKASDLGTWELNTGTNEFNYSERFLEIFGLKKDSSVKHPEILNHIFPEDMQVRKKAFKEAYQTGILQYSSRIIWADKSVHWIENRGKVFYNESNNPQKIIGTTRDITEEKKYQEKLEEREQKFRLLADSMPQFVWTGDGAGNLNYFSRAVYDYSGLSPLQIQKDGWLQIVHPEDREANIQSWLHAVKTGTDFIFEHRFQRHDGVYRWQLSRAIPQKDADGKVQMWVGTSTDIQEMKEQDQQKDFFISMASHELKTPITSIKGYVQILQSIYKKSEDAFLKNSLNTIDKQILTLTNLIADLLDVSKIKSGSLVLNKENFEITDLIKEVVEEITHINPDYSIGFSHTGKAPVVYADKGRIGQVLINFLTNAVKYSPDSKKVVVKSFIQDHQLLVSVQDSGIGISKADQEKIFERFYRVEGKNEKTFPGFGIGLFIASEIIKRHDGKIGVTSEPDKGSVFFFSIPLSNN
jgi:PAS domain S-box-containing protein